AVPLQPASLGSRFSRPEGFTRGSDCGFDLRFDPRRRKNETRRVPAPHPDYVELRCASAFSFLAGASNPEDLATRAAETGHRALALADRDGLYGIPRFHQAATAAGLEAIVGARVTVGVSPPRGSSPAKPSAKPSGSSAKPSGSSGRELLLLVETPRGYRHLSRLLTLAHAK